MKLGVEVFQHTVFTNVGSAQNGVNASPPVPAMRGLPTFSFCEVPPNPVAQTKPVFESVKYDDNLPIAADSTARLPRLGPLSTLRGPDRGK
jgi:hypothetical protein